MSIKSIPKEARPREKLITYGAQALADVELLALLLRTGTRNRPVLTMATELLEQFGGLGGLLNTSTEELKKFKGLGGTAKRAELTAVLELSRRAMTQQLRESPVFTHPKAVQDYVQLHLGQQSREVFALLFLDSHNRLIAMKNLFYGTLSQSSVYPREVVIESLVHNAHAVILAHNHPSGDVTPSAADLEVTRLLRQALALIDIEVLDHIIVSPNNSCSLAQRGNMD